jgi:hypothetical protein
LFQQLLRAFDFLACQHQVGLCGLGLGVHSGASFGHLCIGALHVSAKHGHGLACRDVVTQCHRQLFDHAGHGRADIRNLFRFDQAARILGGGGKGGQGHDQGEQARQCQGQGQSL